MEKPNPGIEPPAKTKTTPLLLIAVLVIALAAGALIWYVGWGMSSESTTPVVESLTVKTTPTPTPTPSADGNSETAAQAVLETFFDYASSGQYAEAAKLLEPLPEGGEVAQSWNDMPGLGTDNPPTDHGEILEIYCDTFETCLAVEVLSATEETTDLYQFEVQFLNADGSVYEMGPCCGEVGPPTTKFIYYVKKIDGDWKVITAPPYHP